MGKADIPKGLIAFGVFQVLTYAASIPQLTMKYSHVISFGQIVDGFTFKAFYLAQIFVGCWIGVGLLRVKRWAFVSYFIFTGFFLTSLLVNILLVDERLLIRAGWVPKNALVHNYRIVMLIGIVIGMLLSVWLYTYRNYFKGIRPANQAL